MFLKKFRSNAIYLSICFLAIYIQTRNSTQLETVWDNFYYLFYGVSSTGFSLYTYIFFNIVFLGSPFLNQHYFYATVNGEFYYLLIRFQSFNNWFKQLFKEIIIGSSLIIIILFAYTFLFSLLWNLKIENSFTVENNGTINILIYHYFINGFLQMINYNLILLIVVCSTKKIEYVLLSSGILLILGLPNFNLQTLFPVALNSFGYMTLNFSDTIQITITLTFYIVIEIIIIQYLLNKRIIIS